MKYAYPTAFNKVAPVLWYWGHFVESCGISIFHVAPVQTTHIEVQQSVNHCPCLGVAIAVFVILQNRFTRQIPVDSFYRPAVLLSPYQESCPWCRHRCRCLEPGYQLASCDGGPVWGA